MAPIPIGTERSRDPVLGLLAFALAIEAQKVIQAFRSAGLKPEPVAHRSGEFVLTSGSMRWRALICGPGREFPAGLERGLASLESIPSVAILAGFAGGLAPAAQTGSVWVVSQIQSPEATWHLPLAAPLASILQAPNANLWAAAKPISSAEDKKALAASAKADIVDMESGTFAALMSRRRIPFAVVRAVSDGPDEALPEEMGAWCGPTGSLRMATVLWDLLTKPYIWRSLPRLAKGAHWAGKALAAALAIIVQSDKSWRATTASRP